MDFSNLIILIIFIGNTKVDGGAIEIFKSFKEVVDFGGTNLLKWKIMTYQGENMVEQKFYRNNSYGKDELIFSGNSTNMKVVDSFQEKFETSVDPSTLVYTLKISNFTIDLSGSYRLDVKFFITAPLLEMMTNHNKIDFIMRMAEPLTTKKVQTKKVQSTSTSQKPTTISDLPKSSVSPAVANKKKDDDKEDYFFASTIFISITSAIGGALIILLVIIIVLICRKKGDHRRPIKTIEHNVKTGNHYIPSRNLPSIPKRENDEFRSGSDLLIPLEIETKSSRHKVQTEEHCRVKLTGESYYMVPKNQKNLDVKYEEIPLNIDSDGYQNMSSGSPGVDYENVWKNSLKI